MGNLLKSRLLIITFSLLTLQAAFAQDSLPDSAVTQIAPEYNAVGAAHRFWLGDSYRNLYSTPVKMRVLNLQKEHGGLTVIKLGGGMQTESLRFKDTSGREWVLRSIQKYPERSLPENLRHTIAKDIVQDQISIAHPFGALTVPPFSDALDIPNASPELVYVRDNPALGEYREQFKNRAYMFEPRTPFEDSKTDNTLKVQRKYEEDNDTRVNQQLTLRARMLDFILGDWDRHEDNWRWDPEKVKGEKIYTPVPRDRDKVYYKTSGILPLLLSYQWLKAHLQPYSDHIRNVGQWTFNARHFDRYFLNQLSKKEWENEIRYVQARITDQLIDSAISCMPDTIVALSGAELAHHIRSRRDSLMKMGLEYYAILARDVDIPASQKQEFIDLDYHKDGSVTLEMHNKKKDGTAGRKLMERRFYPQETKEVRIYGLGGKDVFSAKGKSPSPIKVRFIGGREADSYQLTDSFHNGRRLYIYDDPNKTVNNFPGRARAKLRLDKDTSVYRYDRNSFKYDRTGILAMINYNIDRGILLGAGFLAEKQGFRKEPYAVKHEFWTRYSSERQSFIFSYTGDFKKFAGKNDLFIDVQAWGPNNQGNFFGLGNNTVFNNDDDDFDDDDSFDDDDDHDGISYYRNRYDKISVNLLLKRILADHWLVTGGSASEWYTSSAANNHHRYFEQYNTEHPEAGVFRTYLFTGVTAGLQFDNRDDADNPTRGVNWATSIDLKTQVNGAARTFSQLNTAFSFYQSTASKGIVLANRTGAGAVWGNPLFIQHVQLGGQANLRGYHTGRFSGKTMVYNNLELRMRLFDFDSYLVPGTVGLIGFNDIGRVWMTDESSSAWHTGYGGGFYITPADLLLIQAVAGFSREGWLPYVMLGLRF